MPLQRMATKKVGLVHFRLTFPIVVVVVVVIVIETVTWGN